MTDPDELRYRLNQERIRAQEGIARDRLRTQEVLASERGSRSVALQTERFGHQRNMEQERAASRSDVARITGQYDIDLARMEHQQLPERLAIEHEFAALDSELRKDELLHEVSTRALFEIVEFAAKAEISGSFDAARDERQFSHAIELEKLRQQGRAGSPESIPEPSSADLAAWYGKIEREQ